MYVICFDYGVGQDNLQRFLPAEFVLQIYFWMVNEVLNEPEIILWVLTAGLFFCSCSTGIVLTLTKSKQRNLHNQSNKQTKNPAQNQAQLGVEGIKLV